MSSLDTAHSYIDGLTYGDTREYINKDTEQLRPLLSDGELNSVLLSYPFNLFDALIFLTL